ncbi:MAG TPA: hypothetical protein VMH05_05280 [Bryobacteraceae bacterium]|nr:hypothetical protein [Bryobacteraceae bacterium]
MKFHRALLVGCLLGLSAAALPAQVEIDNQWVRVERVNLDRESFAARGPSVVVYLRDADDHAAGEVSYVSPGSQRNLASKPLQAIYIQLKQPPSQAAPVSLDPVRLDPQHHIVLLENDRVRAIRTILEPHLKAPMHEHPHYVVVYLTELHTTMAMADGRNIDNVRRPGEIAWRDALKHATENVGDRTAMEIQVELK